MDNTFFKNIFNEIYLLTLSTGSKNDDIIKNIKHIILYAMDNMNINNHTKIYHDAFKDIEMIINKTTSGNISHNIATIRNLCNRWLQFIKE